MLRNGWWIPVGLMLLAADAGAAETTPAAQTTAAAAQTTAPSTQVITLPGQTGGVAQPVAPFVPARTIVQPQATVPASGQTTPIVLTSPAPAPAPAPGARIPGAALRAEIKVDEQHYLAQTVEARRAFELRQAAQSKDFELTVKEKSFWDKRRMRNEFAAKQAKEKKEFDEEQEKKRKMYGWRYP